MEGEDVLRKLMGEQGEEDVEEDSMEGEDS